MSSKASSKSKLGYTKNEFMAIMGVYYKQLPTGLLRDTCFGEFDGIHMLSFYRHARQNPLITIEKRGTAKKPLFIAKGTNERTRAVETLFQSGSIIDFVDMLSDHVDSLQTRSRTFANAGNVFQLRR